MTTEVIDTHKRAFSAFLEHEEFDGKYIDRIKQTIEDGKFRLVVSMNDLRRVNRELAQSLMQRPREHMVALQEAASELAQQDNATVKMLKNHELQVGFEDSLGEHTVTPRGLQSTLLNKLVVVEGIATKCSSVRPKLVRSVHFCPATKQYSSREYRDNTALDIGIEVRGRERLPTQSVVPVKDDSGNPLELEQGLCQYKDYQTIILQEMPERARVGMLPRSIEVILEHDLVDRVKPGDRVQCIGVYRPLTR